MSEQLSSQEYQPQRELLERLLALQPTVIGIEGGPCSGKTTLVERLAAGAADSERQLVVLPEAATQHIAKLEATGRSVGELAADDREGFIAFETAVLGTIVEQIEAARERYAGTDAIIVADRVDIAAYLTDAEHRQVLGNLGLAMAPMLDKVDQLYYLPTVARESLERYDELKATNSARYETGEQAVATCEANLRAVARHPELHVLWGGDFTQKISEATAAILAPEEESELKLSGANRDIANSINLAEQAGNVLSQSHISQSYHRLGSTTFRLRYIVTSRGESLYYYTVKTGDGIRRHELQRRLRTEEYELLRQCEQRGELLEKQRYEFLEADLVADLEDKPHRLRQWTADWYMHPRLLDFHLETPVASTHEAHLISQAYRYLGRASMSAADVAMQLVKR